MSARVACVRDGRHKTGAGATFIREDQFATGMEMGRKMSVLCVIMLFAAANSEAWASNGGHQGVTRKYRQDAAKLMFIG